MDVRDAFGGKVAIVTGGASGIGAALGKEIARAGAEVILADRQVDVAESVAASIRAKGGRVSAAELDVRDYPATRELVTRTASRAGSVDYYFNNAGIGVGGEVDSYEPRDWDDVLDVNLRGVAYGVQAAYPVMIAQGGGHLVNTASMAGLVAAPGETSYAASKHGVVALSKALRIEGRRHGVRVSVLCPGVIGTPILTGGKYGRLNFGDLPEGKLRELWDRFRPMNVDVFAQKAVRAVARNEAIIVYPTWWKAFWYLERLSPALSERLWAALLDRMRAELSAAGVRPRRVETNQPS